MWLTAGTLDDRILAHTGPPPLTELPLDPVSLLSVPVVDSTLDAHTATLGLDEHLYGTLALPDSTDFRWPAGEAPAAACSASRSSPGWAPLPARAQQRRRVRGGAGVLGVLPDPPAAVDLLHRSTVRTASAYACTPCGDRPGTADRPRGCRAAVVGDVAVDRRLDREDAHPARGRIAAQGDAAGLLPAQNPVSIAPDAPTLPATEPCR